MKPFSALYFIKENKKRSVLLMLMIFLSFGVYIGGLYVTNPEDNWQQLMEYSDNCVSVVKSSMDGEGYEWLLNEVQKDGKTKVIEIGSSNYFGWKTIMGFESSQGLYTFRSVEDFKTFCNYMDIECDFSKLKSGSMIMSEKFAKNRGFSIGDKVDEKKYSSIYGEYTLDVLTDEDGYTIYFISDEEESGRALILGEKIKGHELYSYVYKLHSQIEGTKNVFVYPGVRQEIEVQFESFNTIYMLIVILLSIILAITINAAFVGMYQKREFEFAVYRAIGIPKKSIIGKFVKELLLLDIIALFFGTIVMLIGLYLLNNLVLYPEGKYLRYFELVALYNMLLCNAIIIIPLIVTRCRKMLKADICDY
ncbi:MAG: ABC transporter permease [Lachnospiraceae bacterium]|nr:ABC transporter permease [Lachnospiraceae bacterium]